MKTCFLLLLAQLSLIPQLWSQTAAPLSIADCVVVLGDFTNPGPVPYTSGMKVLDAIGAAGDYTDVWHPALFLIRAGKSEKINLRALRKDGGVLLQPWDIIYCNPKRVPSKALQPTASGGG